MDILSSALNVWNQNQNDGNSESKELKKMSVQIQGQPKRIKWMGARDQAVLHTVMLLGGGEGKCLIFPVFADLCGQF